MEAGRIGESEDKPFPGKGRNGRTPRRLPLVGGEARADPPPRLLLTSAGLLMEAAGVNRRARALMSLCENSDSNVEDHNMLDHCARRARHAVPLRSRHHVFTQTLMGAAPLRAVAQRR